MEVNVNICHKLFHLDVLLSSELPRWIVDGILRLIYRPLCSLCPPIYVGSRDIVHRFPPASPRRATHALLVWSLSQCRRVIHFSLPRACFAVLQLQASALLYLPRPAAQDWEGSFGVTSGRPTTAIPPRSPTHNPDGSAATMVLYLWDRCSSLGSPSLFRCASLARYPSHSSEPKTN